jgi:hypothetical protein
MRRHSCRARPTFGFVYAMIVVVMLQGCAALPAALGGGALQAGGGALVKTGTEYTLGGTAHRTLTIPIENVHAAVLEVFRRTAISLTRDEASAKGQIIVGEAQHRRVQIRLIPLTGALTSMELKVKRNALVKDRATTSELLEQTEQILAEQPVFARRLHREPYEYPPASP